MTSKPKFTAKKNYAASDAHGYEVWNYYCSKCKCHVDCNGSFNKIPDVNYCGNCGASLGGAE